MAGQSTDLKLLEVRLRGQTRIGHKRQVLSDVDRPVPHELPFRRIPQEGVQAIV